MNFILPSAGQLLGASQVLGNTVAGGVVTEPVEAGAAPLQSPRFIPGCQYQAGDKVKVLPTAFEDVGTMAWPFLMGQVGTIKDGQAVDKQGYVFVAYAVEFDAPFKGGFDCWGATARERGQFIAQQHLERLDT